MRQPLQTILLGFTIAATAFSKRSHDLQRPTGAAEVDVIVQYRTQPTQSNFDRARHRRGQVRRTHLHIPQAAMRVPAEALDELERDPDVIAITPDRPGDQLHGPFEWVGELLASERRPQLD